ncbi:Mini-chromosome maintenance complex-binding protein [Camellia lanceoleosa]|uniref:Mini-chromosome maintenance complex-binding protein n=1 Tax=Camellia lanceoleosa TaxID=1840588 RepID=A0ACC0G323_9ERIC|nr:Mini-chromosome maintenance complex-binding protein [Camellia lanceoleosa]
MMKLQGDSTGRKGHLSVAAEVGFPRLQRLQIVDCEMMEAIVGIEKEKDEDELSSQREGGPASLSSDLEESTTEGTCPSTSMVFDFDRNSFPCLVKVYDSLEADLKLNDVFEFVGVLTFDLEPSVDKDDSDEFTSTLCEDELSHSPPSKVPRLHCLVHRKLAIHDFLSSSPIMEPKSNLVKEMRETLLGHLTAVLGNDGVAAHFMLLHLLSRVHARVDTLAVGKLSLNLTGFNKENVSNFGNRLNLAVKNLVPFTHFIPLTVDYLNIASLSPRKDYETNRLVSGVLQLAEGSHTMIDETHLQAGTLNWVAMLLSIGGGGEGEDGGVQCAVWLEAWWPLFFGSTSTSSSGAAGLTAPFTSSSPLSGSSSVAANCTFTRVSAYKLGDSAFSFIANCLLEAIDLILQGAQNLVVPIKSNSRRKLQESPTTPGRILLTQEDVIRFSQN